MIVVVALAVIDACLIHQILVIFLHYISLQHFKKNYSKRFTYERLAVLSVQKRSPTRDTPDVWRDVVKSSNTPLSPLVSEIL